MKKLNSVIKAVIGYALLITVLFLFSNTGHAGELIANGKKSVIGQKAQATTMAPGGECNTDGCPACKTGKCAGGDKKTDAKLKTAKTKVKHKCADETCGSGNCDKMDKKTDARVGKDANATDTGRAGNNK